MKIINKDEYGDEDSLYERGRDDMSWWPLVRTTSREMDKRESELMG